MDLPTAIPPHIWDSLTEEARAVVRVRYPHSDLVITIFTHGAIWGLLGAVDGLAFAVGLGERNLWVRALAAGFVGALVGAFAFDLIGVFAFPTAKTDDPISRTWVTRLMARLLVTLATAAALSLVAPGRSCEPSGPRRE
jgi:hypothetical protein